MMKRSRYTALAVMAVSTVLVACSGLPDLGNSKRAAAREEDRAGRINLSIGDKPLEADPEMVDVAVILPDSRVIEQWPQAGATASKVVGHVAAGANFEIAWRVNAGDGSSTNAALTSAPVASRDAIFVMDAGQNVRAFALEDGARRWSVSLKSGSRRDQRSFGGGIAIADDLVIATSGYGFAVALDIETGEERWRREFAGPTTGAPTIKDDRAFIVSQNNEIFALRVADGSLEWSDQAISESARVLSSPSPAAVEELVVVPYSSGEVIAYLGLNGRRLWTDALVRTGRFTPISSINDISSRPVLSSGLVFASSQSGLTTAIDGRSGQRVWSQPIGSVFAPSITGEYLFLSGVEGQVVCMAVNNGAVIWATQLQRFGNEKKKSGRITYAGPIIASNRVIVASSKGELVAMSPQTGEETARLKLGAPVFLEPIAVGDKLIILTDEGRLIAVR
ncbi:MAG: PQQ-binding-like beta-propeller repeat protein [Hyphomonadaceae bacterium]